MKGNKSFKRTKMVTSNRTSTPGHRTVELNNADDQTIIMIWQMSSIDDPSVWGKPKIDIMSTGTMIDPAVVETVVADIKAALEIAHSVFNEWSRAQGKKVTE